MVRLVLALLLIFAFSFSQNVLEEVRKSLEGSREDLKVARENLEYVKKKVEELEAKLNEHLKFHQTLLSRVRKEVEKKKGLEVKKKRPKLERGFAYGIYEVKPCDTLWGISSKVYKNPYYWPTIYHLNEKSIGKDPWIIRIGLLLRFKLKLTEEEKRKAFKEAVYWDRKFKNRPRSPLCPPGYRKRR